MAERLKVTGIGRSWAVGFIAGMVGVVWMACAAARHSVMDRTNRPSEGGRPHLDAGYYEFDLFAFR